VCCFLRSKASFRLINSELLSLIDDLVWCLLLNMLDVPLTELFLEGDTSLD